MMRCKQQLQNQLIESFKMSAANSPRGLKANIRITENDQRKIQKKQSRSLDNQPQYNKFKIDDTSKNHSNHRK
jgi:hypothetical protein